MRMDIEDESRIRKLLEHIMETGCTAEEACRDDADLLTEVKRRQSQLALIEAQIDAAFPSSGNVTSDWRTPRQSEKELPAIDGYEVEHLLGRGGMGLVFRGRHLKLNRIVAIKMLLAGEFASSIERARFVREAEAVASLRHANIVQVHDLGAHLGRPYFTMEFVEGGTLAEKLAGIPQPARDAAVMVQTLANAVQAAHDGGVVHRDLKPSNILLTADGAPKITDFGLAQHVQSDTALTYSGAKIGSPSYMAPEQALGTAGTFCPLVDVYGLGTILYELLTGRPPFRAESAAETQRQVVEEEPAPPSRLNAKVPRDLETICIKCLKKDPKKRYTTAADLASDLIRFTEGKPIQARPIGRLERFLSWTKRHPSDTALFVAVCILIAVAILFGIREWSRHVQQHAEMRKWAQQLAFVINLQQEGRFAEGRAILDRAPHVGSDELRRQIESARADLDLAERLDAIRLSRGLFVQGGGIDYSHSARQYKAIFHEAILGVLGDPPEIVAARLADSPIRSAFIAALDDWAACADAEPRQWVLDVARRLDPDPWRDRVRDQANWANTDHLAELAELAAIDEQPVNLLVAMGTRWRRIGGDPTTFLQRVQQRHPSDFWVNFELGHLLMEQDPRTAVGYYRGALAVRPNAAVIHYNLGNHFRRNHDNENAIHHYLQTIDNDPNHTWAYSGLGTVMLAVGRLEESAKYYERATQLDSEDPQLDVALRTVLVRLGRLDEARHRWERLLERLDTDATFADWDGYAELCLFLDDEHAYHKACEVLLPCFGDMTDPRKCERMSRACLLRCNSAERVRNATSLIDRALAADPSSYPSWAYEYFLLTKALAEYRADQWEAAILTLERVGPHVLPPAPALVLAMAQHRSGHTEEAQKTLQSAGDQYDWQLENAIHRESWMLHILRREAQSLILPDPPENSGRVNNPFSRFSNRDTAAIGFRLEACAGRGLATW